MDGICCACVTYTPGKSCLKCGDRERAPERVGSSCGVALVGGDCRLAACGGGMVLPALLAVPVGGDAVAVPAG